MKCNECGREVGQLVQVVDQEQEGVDIYWLCLEHLNKKEPLPMVGLRTPDIRQEPSEPALYACCHRAKILEMPCPIHGFSEVSVEELAAALSKEEAWYNPSAAARDLAQAILSKYDIRRR
jgi:hypothetical protein